MSEELEPPLLENSSQKRPVLEGESALRNMDGGETLVPTELVSDYFKPSYLVDGWQAK